jgi:hypothetical protein
MKADVEGVVRGMEIMRGIQDNLGELYPEQGIVRAEQYTEALDALRQMQEQVIEQLTSDEQEKEIWRAEWLFGN